MKNIVIVDLDGTISKPGERLKYLQQEPKNWTKFYEDCFEDEPIVEVLDLVDVLCWSDLYEVVFCTGRRECVRDKTTTWLKRHSCDTFGHCKLLMRKDGDTRPDIEVKPELLQQNGYTPDKVAFVIEDRTCVVKKYRELGYTVLQCAEGDF